VFLNHGGRLDEMCFDESPGEKIEKKWLSAQLAGPIIRKFRKEAPGDVDLLFLQQCGRGSVENIYNFRGSAKAVMASQMNVGAPNTYYENTMKWLVTEQKPSGFELARQIMSNDKHFSNYVCVNGDSLEELPKQLDLVIQALLDDRKTNLTPPADLQPCYQYEEETNYDLLEWLNGVVNGNKRSQKSLELFKKWLREKLIVATEVHPGVGERVKGWCGLALWVPEREKVRGRYPDYPIFQNSRLNDLWNVMYPKVKKKEKP
jgi:hypothetical protein